MKYDTLPLSDRPLQQQTSVPSDCCSVTLVYEPMCSCSKVSGCPHHGRNLPPLSRPRPQSFCCVTVDASICYSYCINNITLHIRKCRQHVKTSQMCGDTSLSYGLDGRAVGHPPCIAGTSHLFPSPHPSSHNRAVAPTHQTLLPSLIGRPTALVGKCTKSIPRFIPDFQMRYPDLRKIRY